MSDIVNNGTGAGGARAPANGIRLEEKTRGIISANVDTTGISSGYGPYSRGAVWVAKDITYQNKTYIRAPQASFKFFEEEEGGGSVPKAHGAKNPDDLIINKETKTINWIECKVQNGKGSVAEKLQTPNEKIVNLERRFPGWKINYVYILSSYFRKGVEWEISRLEENKINYVFEDDPQFENKLLECSFL